MRVYGDDDPDHPIHESPMQDLLAVVLDGRRTHLTTATLRALMDAQCVVVLSDDRHMPNALMLPLTGYSQGARRTRLLANLSLPARKRIWRDLVVAKIRAQADALAAESDARRELLGMARQVKSGDTDNREAQAARIYWPAFWDDPDYRRRGDLDPRNALLNYGYAIVRAAVARTVVASGLHGAFGVSHHARENHFALADDLMEPLRPFVDRCARRLWLAGAESLGRTERADLLSVVHGPCRVGDDAMPIWMGIQRLGQSLAAVVEGTRDKLAIPCAPPLDEPCD